MKYDCDEFDIIISTAEMCCKRSKDHVNNYRPHSNQNENPSQWYIDSGNDK